MPANVQVTPVRGFGDLREFVHLPMRLHAGTLWIPQLILERYLFMNRKMNAFFKHGRAEYFLARRDGRVVGRITAQVNDRYNRQHDRRRRWSMRCSPRPRPGCVSTAWSGWLARWTSP
jgi:hypothetical protein